MSEREREGGIGAREREGEIEGTKSDSNHCEERCVCVVCVCVQMLSDRRGRERWNCSDRGEQTLSLVFLYTHMCIYRTC